MPRQASFAVLILLSLFSQLCFGEQPKVVSTAALSGLRGSVKSVLTEGFTYGDKGEKSSGFSEISIYDRVGYEKERDEYATLRSTEIRNARMTAATVVASTAQAPIANP